MNVLRGRPTRTANPSRKEDLTLALRQARSRGLSAKTLHTHQHRILQFASAFACFLLATCVAIAQSTFGSVRGNVQDASGAAISGATAS